MPIAAPQAYRNMLDKAKAESFAFPAVNCVGSEAINAALKDFADGSATASSNSQPGEQNSRRELASKIWSPEPWHWLSWRTLSRPSIRSPSRCAVETKVPGASDRFLTVRGDGQIQGRTKALGDQRLRRRRSASCAQAGLRA